MARRLGEKKFIASRISQAKSKLELACPVRVLLKDLSISIHSESAYYGDIQKTIMEAKLNGKDELDDAEELVEALLKLSTDKALLVRMWMGWLAFI